MIRRDFIRSSACVLAAGVSSSMSSMAAHLDVDWYRRSRKFADLSFGRIAYVEHGRGPAALFVHGYPLNSYQWRGALERLHTVRRCIAPDLLALGYSESRQGQVISPSTQAEMLAALLDHRKVDTVDLIANDSGGITAQLFVAKFPLRVRTLLLTNCDVDTNNPPPQFAPFVVLARNGTLVDQFVLSQWKDHSLARSQRGLGQAFSYPEKLADETIEYYLAPISGSARRAEFNDYTNRFGRERLGSYPRRPSPMAGGGTHGLGTQRHSF
jgi:haloalkane dehalogenase